MSGYGFPDGKKFALTVIDDTDVATVENVRPVYDLLDTLGMRTTKTVWPVGCPEGSAYYDGSQTLEDPEYRSFVIALRERGFEITWHAATMESSRRERTEAGLRRFREILGSHPRIHANHGFNREGIYWGADRIDVSLLRLAYRLVMGRAAGSYQGTVPDSPYWWGDLCAEHIDYGRNLTFNDLNLARINPSMPYRDPRRPLVKWWFSASDAENCAAFNRLLRSEAQDALEREGGFSVIATHFGKEFVKNGELNASTRQLLEELASRDGWFPTVGELLDHLRGRHPGDSTIPSGEWRRMQWRWAADLIARRRRGY